MTDINYHRRRLDAGKRGEIADGIPLNLPGELRWDLIELLFFAYRDFVGDPDEVLAKLKFGRAHHRVLHFVYRYPGLKVADLLEVLRITKQSLSRVLKQLLSEDYIVQKAGSDDRRQRLLFATPKGEVLVISLADLQTERIERALASVSPTGGETVKQFLRAMIDQEDPDMVLKAHFKSDSLKLRE